MRLIFALSLILLFFGSHEEEEYNILQVAVCKDKDFTDENGLGCEIYVIDGLCSKGFKSEDGETTAASACCKCGGGIKNTIAWFIYFK